MSNQQPTLLSESMALRALADNMFYQKLPEFTGLRAQHQALEQSHKYTASGKGCRNCGNRKMHNTLFRQFVNIATALNENAKGRLRAYMGGNTLMVNTVDPKTNRVNVRLI